MNRRIRRTALLLAAMLCFAAVGTTAGAEARRQDTKKGSRVVQSTWVDEHGNPTAGPEGWAIVKYEYHKDGTTERYYDAEEEPFRMSGGYYGCTITTDFKKRISSIVYLNEAGEREENDMGYSRVKMDYTSFGEMRYLCYYGEGNNPVTVPALGYAGMEATFRGKTLTGRTWFNEDGKPADTVMGYAVMTQRVNKKNQITAISYAHADGSPATCADGWSRCEKELDKEGRELTAKYYTESGALTDRGAGYAWEENKYIGKNEVQVTRYDLNGQKTAFPDGYSVLRRQLKNGQILRESYLDSAGQPILNGQGVAATSYTYDHEGRIYMVFFEDAKGKECLNNSGYAGYRDTFDSDGLTLTRTYLAPDGKAVDLPAGYCEIRYSYNLNKQVTEIRYFNTEGAEVSGS